MNPVDYCAGSKAFFAVGRLKEAAKEDAGKSDLAETKPKAKRKPPIKSLEQIVCPLCGKGHLLKGRTAYGCSEFRQGCSLRLSFDEFPESLTPSKLNASIKKHFK